MVLSLMSEDHIPISIKNTFPEYPVKLLSEFSSLHFNDQKTRLEIADLAEAWEKVNLPAVEEVTKVEEEKVLV